MLAGGMEDRISHLAQGSACLSSQLAFIDMFHVAFTILFGHLAVTPKRMSCCIVTFE